MTTETIRRDDRDRVAVLSIDHPDRSLNVVDESVLADLRRHVDAILTDDGVDAIVLTSAKSGSFGSGADLAWLPELAARDDAESFLAGVHELMVALMASPKPMVTAVNGAAFGGALELALGGRAIVAVPDAQVGLPEVTLGLLPGGGGTQLLGRFVDAAVAAELLTSGRRIGAAEAHQLGLVAEVVDTDALLDTAVDHARSLIGTAPSSVPAGDEAAAVTRRDALTRSRGGVSPAADRILTALRVGATEGLAAGLAAERRGFLACVRSPEARAAVHLFQVEAAVKRRSRGDGKTIARIGVVGGGQMGAGIAATAVSRELTATVRDVSEESLDRARAYRDKVLARQAPAGGDDPRADRWHGTTGWDGFADAEAVIEAVFELPELKTDILRELSSIVPTTSLLATNTSAISIGDLATAVAGAERFLGMHFFSPVDRMPLVELIPHAGTSAETSQRAAALGRQLGKVPVLVGDAPGFFTSRVYARWLVEGLRCLLDGATASEVDAAAEAVGFPVGPLRAHDEATLDLVVQASITQVAESVMPDRLDVAGVRDALEKLLAADVQGRRHGLGFYRYDEDGKRVGPNDEVLSLLGVAPTGLSRDVVGERLLLAFATECYLCWDDGTLCHPDDGDVAAVLGIGFPRVLGGPFHWADETGAAALTARCAALGTREFPPGPSLERFAKAGGRFGDQPRRPAPFEEPGAGVV
ncbi:MAG: 3-hydroxyacyl-CoA dehydrogenase NAD-binding domain-containing protein [Chloroflexota bacterium]